jgi:hypothetical protein
MFPLPKQKKDSINQYQSIWRTHQDYYNEVETKRIELIMESISKSKVELIVSYDRTLSTDILNYFSENINLVNRWEHGHEQYSIYKLYLSSERNVYFLSTPFFGNGRINYVGLKNAADRTKMVINGVLK